MEPRVWFYLRGQILVCKHIQTLYAHTYAHWNSCRLATVMTSRNSLTAQGWDKVKEQNGLTTTHTHTHLWFCWNIDHLPSLDIKQMCQCCEGQIWFDLFSNDGWTNPIWECAYCVRLLVDLVTFLDSHLDSVFTLGLLMIWCFTVFTHKPHWDASLWIQKSCLMSWPDLIATSGAHSALIWQYSREGVTVFRGCLSLAEVSEDSITRSVYRSRSRDVCFYGAFCQKDSRTHIKLDFICTG